MIELGLREHTANDGLFQERLDAFMDKSIADIKAFAERESRPFEEVVTVLSLSPSRALTEIRPGDTWQSGMRDIFSNRETLSLLSNPRGMTKVLLPAMPSIS